MADGGDRRFGELPLPQTRAAAAAIRRLTGMLLSLEQPIPVVDEVLTAIDAGRTRLAPPCPSTIGPG